MPKSIDALFDSKTDYSGALSGFSDETKSAQDYREILFPNPSQIHLTEFWHCRQFTNNANAFALGLGAFSGCSYFTQERVAGTASTVLETAYVAGGATKVGQKIDQMVADGKITAEQATLLKAAAQKSYADLQARLKELAVADVEVTVTK